MRQWRRYSSHRPPGISTLAQLPSSPPHPAPPHPIPLPHTHATRQWLEIKPTDDEKTVARKKKLLKSYKSKKRFQEMDIKQKQRADNWQHFLKGKGGKPKQGGCRAGQEHILAPMNAWEVQQRERGTGSLLRWATKGPKSVLGRGEQPRCRCRKCCCCRRCPVCRLLHRAQEGEHVQGEAAVAGCAERALHMVAGGGDRPAQQLADHLITTTLQEQVGWLTMHGGEGRMRT